MVFPGVKFVLAEARAIIFFVGEVIHTVVVGMGFFKVFDYVALLITVHDGQTCCRKRHGQHSLCNISDV